MPSRTNRRVQGEGRAPRRRRPPARRRRASTASPNRRVAGEASRRQRRPASPEERKARNRTVLVIALLALVNVYVFGVRRQGLDQFALPAAIGATAARSGFADPIASACGGDPVRIFEGLERQLALETRLTRGRTLRLGLLELGVPGGQIDELEAAVRSHIDLGLIAASGAPLRITTDREGRVSAIEVELAEGHLVQACREGDELRVRNIQHPLRSEVAVVAMRLPRSGDLSEAVREAEESPELARAAADLLAYDVDFMFEARPGDELQLLVEKRYLGPHFHRYGAIMAARYRGAGGYFAYYYYKPPGMEGGYFDGYGDPMRRSLRRSPSAFYPVERDQRGGLAPTVEFVDGRAGALFRRAEGAPVVALGDGVVLGVHQREAGGHTVEIELEDGRVVTYAHLLRTMGQLGTGERVRAGQLIGLAGHSGQARDDRVRIELRDGERILDPLTSLASGDRRAPRIGAAIPKELIEQFERDIEPWRQAMRSAARG